MQSGPKSGLNADCVHWIKYISAWLLPWAHCLCSCLHAADPRELLANYFWLVSSVLPTLPRADTTAPSQAVPGLTHPHQPLLMSSLGSPSWATSLWPHPAHGDYRISHSFILWRHPWHVRAYSPTQYSKPNSPILYLLSSERSSRPPLSHHILPNISNWSAAFFNGTLWTA